MFGINFEERDNLAYVRVRSFWSPFKGGWTPFIRTREKLSDAKRWENLVEGLGVSEEELSRACVPSSEEVCFEAPEEANVYTTLCNCAKEVENMAEFTRKASQANALRELSAQIGIFAANAQDWDKRGL